VKTIQTHSDTKILEKEQTGRNNQKKNLPVSQTYSLFGMPLQFKTGLSASLSETVINYWEEKRKKKQTFLIRRLEVLEAQQKIKNEKKRKLSELELLTKRDEMKHLRHEFENARTLLDLIKKNREALKTALIQTKTDIFNEQVKFFAEGESDEIEDYLPQNENIKLREKQQDKFEEQFFGVHNYLPVSLTNETNMSS